MINLVRDACRAEMIVAAICHGGWLLCSADVVRGRRATGSSAIQVDMTNAGAGWVDQEVVRDANVVTSRTPDDLPAFMRTIIAGEWLFAEKPKRLHTRYGSYWQTWKARADDERKLLEEMVGTCC